MPRSSDVSRMAYATFQTMWQCSPMARSLSSLRGTPSLIRWVEAHTTYSEESSQSSPPATTVGVSGTWLVALVALPNNWAIHAVEIAMMRLSTEPEAKTDCRTRKANLQEIQGVLEKRYPTSE